MYDRLAGMFKTYLEIVTHPMDLGTVKRKLERREYASPDDFAADVRLVFQNCVPVRP